MIGVGMGRGIGTETDGREAGIESGSGSATEIDGAGRGRRRRIATGGIGTGEAEVGIGRETEEGIGERGAGRETETEEAESGRGRVTEKIGTRRTDRGRKRSPLEERRICSRSLPRRYGLGEALSQCRVPVRTHAHDCSILCAHPLIWLRFLWGLHASFSMLGNACIVYPCDIESPACVASRESINAARAHIAYSNRFPH